MQQKVRQRFRELQEMDETDGSIPWYIVDAAGTIEEVQTEINGIVESTIEKIQSEEKEIGLLWKK